MQIDEAFADSQAPNAAAIKNARGVVIKRKLVGLFRSADGTLLDREVVRLFGRGQKEEKLLGNTRIRSWPQADGLVAGRTPETVGIRGPLSEGAKLCLDSLQEPFFGEVLFRAFGQAACSSGVATLFGDQG